jgi:hypothetical protein
MIINIIIVINIIVMVAIYKSLRAERRCREQQLTQNEDEI